MSDIVERVSDIVERVSDLDLDALITTWERNPNLLGFRDAVLSSLRELKERRASPPAEPQEQVVERVAAAIANVRGARRGMPPITNVLTILPAKLKDEVMEDARAALAASM